MAYPKKFTDKEVVDLYNELGSIWKTADALNVCGQSVHERLHKIGGVIKTPNRWSKDDVEFLKENYNSYANKEKLSDLANELGRLKSNVCRKARSLGLTNMNRTMAKNRVKEMSKRAKDWHANNDHPRGMLGKTHTENVKNILSKAHSERQKNMTEEEQSEITLKMLKTKEVNGTLYNNHRKTSWKQGWRTVDGREIYFRSRWEANYGRYLQFLKENGDIKEWEHEPKTFWFEKIKRGTRSYLPDFRVTKNNGEIEYHEVKGWMDKKSKTKLKRMKKYHPDVKMILIRKKQYNDIKKKLSGVIKGWE